MNRKEIARRLTQDPEALVSAMEITSELLTTSLVDALSESAGLMPLVKIYGVVDFLWEIEMYDAAFDLIQALFGMAGIELPDVFMKLMSDEESARDYVGSFLEDYLEQLNGFCLEKCGCLLCDVEDGEMGG